HLLHRSDGWPIEWDLTVLGSSLDSAQGLVLALLAVVGLVATKGSQPFDERDRRERYLCAATALALMAVAAITRPTLEEYFVIAIPFVAMLAAFGVVGVASIEGLTPSHRSLFALVAAMSFLITPARLMHKLSASGEHMWQSIDAIGTQIDRVT